MFLIAGRSKEKGCSSILFSTMLTQQLILSGCLDLNYRLHVEVVERLHVLLYDHPLRDTSSVNSPLVTHLSLIVSSFL